MRILVTGANGYIGQRLVLSLLEQGHKVVCLVRDPKRFDKNKYAVEVVQGDLLQIDTLQSIPKDIEVAYYLVHSMSSKNRRDFDVMERTCAENFVKISETILNFNLKQVIYLSGISNDENLSKHLSSRKKVEDILRQGKFHLTVLRAAIIIGSGGASFEIIRDLVEKLPIMIAPKWLNVKCQPIAIRNVIQYLTGVIMKEKAFDKVFDIGGPDILTYKEMLLGYAKVRGLKRYIFTIPLLTPRLSAYWLNFITSTNYALARTLVSSLKNEVICKNNGIKEIVPIECFPYQIAIEKTLFKVAKDDVPSSWKDAFNTKTNIKTGIRAGEFEKITVPEHGCLFDLREMEFTREVNDVRDNIWMIGGNRGWYYLDWMWKLRGDIDKLLGGVGLKRGRRTYHELKVGDVLDFWRVLQADYNTCHLILYAEMKIPGEAWLEFKVENKEGKNILIQKATFRPQGLLGRLYWYALIPIHHLLFEGMAKRIVSFT